MKKCISLLLALSMLLGLLSGCGKDYDNSGYIPTGDAILMEDQEPEDILEEELEEQEVGLAYYPDRSLNPIFGSDYTNRVIMSLMYQPLFAVDGKKNVTPILVSRYQVSANRRNLTVYLEPNATYSDGTRVTPADVVACYWQAKENDYYKNRFRHVINIEATEDGGVLFQTDTAYQNLPLLLDVPIVKEAEVNALQTPPLGSGPYVFNRTNLGATLERNPNWWCGDTKIPVWDPSIELVEVTSTADVRDQFQFGNVSVVCTNPMSGSFAEYRCDYELWEIESGYMMYIGCNILYSDHFEDGTLRTFLTYGINREALAQEAYNGLVETITLPCAPTESYYSNYLAKNYEYDALKFISKLAGYRIPQKKEGGDDQLVLLVNSADSARVRIARQIAKDLTEMGLPCATLESSGSNFKNIIVAGNYDIYLGMTRLSANMDLSEFFRPYGEMSRGGLQHETLYEMCLNSLQDYGNYYNLYQKLAEDGRIIPVMFGYYNVYAERGLMPDLAPSRDNVFYYSMGKTMEACEIQAEYEQ
ncbi:MAG: hypothetical protein IJO21_05415 [Oscillospiraceae bacterium]|nr:hypothetical protein [Oscillospiraceae bacterium]MBQ7130464.1 hypothetical protein [Oscillospiraceae bacterium]